jgi:hypothetical protein
VREKRDEIIILRTTKAEKNRIYEKMLGMGIPKAHLLTYLIGFAPGHAVRA